LVTWIKSRKKQISKMNYKMADSWQTPGDKTPTNLKDNPKFMAARVVDLVSLLKQRMSTYR
jgi:hypothetical protein